MTATDAARPRGSTMENINGNDLLAFVVEVAAFVTLGLWGWHAGPSTAASIILASVVVGGAIILWGLFAAPRARLGTPGAALAVKVVVLGGAVLAAFVVIPLGWAVFFAAVVVVNTVLMYVGPLARRSRD